MRWRDLRPKFKPLRYLISIFVLIDEKTRVGIEPTKTSFPYLPWPPPTVRGEERVTFFLLTTIVAAAYGESFRKHAPQAPRVGAHDVILTGLDEESDSTNEEMPPLEPLEPLEGAAQLGEVWLCGHERRM